MTRKLMASSVKRGMKVSGLLVVLILIAAVFAAIAPLTTASQFMTEKETMNAAGTAVDPTMTYMVGDTARYIINYNNTDPAYSCILDLWDILPNGNILMFGNDVFFAPGQKRIFYYNYTINAGDVRAAGTDGLSYDHIANYARTDGTNENEELIIDERGKFSQITYDLPPSFDFTWAASGCYEVEFTPWYTSGTTITNHTWTFGDGTNSGIIAGPPGTITHTYASCGMKTFRLSGYDSNGLYNDWADIIYVDCGPTAVAKASSSCFEANGSDIIFDGSGSYGESTPLSYSWTFTGGFTGDNDNAAITTVMVNAPITASLTVIDALGCTDNAEVSIGPCGGCSLRLYGAFGEGPGNFNAIDPLSQLSPESKPYTQPEGPFNLQSEEAPRSDFITFNPAIMDHEHILPGIIGDWCEWDDFAICDGVKQKVFKRMWYENEWFTDYTMDGEWDFATDAGVMTMSQWLAYPQWDRPEIREWNSPTMPDWKTNADIYGPSIVQEFTYMTLDQNWYPIMVQNGKGLLIPMASWILGNGLGSYDAEGDGIPDAVFVESEQTVGIDIDGDGILEPMDADATALNGNENVVLKLESQKLDMEHPIQFFDHIVRLSDVQSPGSSAVFHICDNEGGGSQRCTENVVMSVNDVRTFYRGRPGNSAERPTFYIRLISVHAGNDTAIVEVGRLFGQTHANIQANPYRSQKAFMVDGVLYNVVAIKAEDNCLGYITFRQSLPKIDIMFLNKHLTRWDPGEILAEMHPFDTAHYVVADVIPRWPEPPVSQQDKIGEILAKPPLEIDYIIEDREYRYHGELKEIYAAESTAEYWDLEWYQTQPWQFTEIRLPKDDRYLVTLSWYANESGFALWGADLNEPEVYGTGERLSFWYEDCTGPLYIDSKKDSIRLFGTFGEGPGDSSAVDSATGLAPEHKPYTDPEGPFDPENEQAPEKDFLTFNPAYMRYTLGYPELEFFKCAGGIVSIPTEKVFKRMWYEESWFDDHNGDGAWDVVIEQYNDVQKKWLFYDVMTLAEWNAIPAYEKILNRFRIREMNDQTLPGYNPDADTYAPSINQEFTYTFLDEDIMPVMIGAGSSVLIPMASWSQSNGLDSFDADGDGLRDAVFVESEQTVGIDIDGDSVLEPMDADATALNGDENVVLKLENKLLHIGNEIRFFDHTLVLWDVLSTGTDYRAVFSVCDSEGGGSQRCTDNVVMSTNDVQTFYRGRPGNIAEKPVFYIRLITADATTDTAVVEVGRLFGQTHANIQANPYRSQKAFMVDGVLYNVVAIRAEDNCIGYITFRQTLPKTPVNLLGKDLKWWGPGEILPEMPPFNQNHDVVIDVQVSWTRPYSQQDKIGPLILRPPMEITWMVEDVDPRFKIALKEIYRINEITGDAFWAEEWFWTQPWQYTAFVVPVGELYLMTLAWYAPESEITIWNNDSAEPASSYTGERVKFWYDPMDDTDIYVNRLGVSPPPVNNPPNPPTNLKQLKSDGETIIPVGNTTDERTVVFKGTVSDPDGDRVRLQVELRRLDEYEGQFNETKGDLNSSELVENGSEAYTSFENWVDDDYHWRARAVDEHGKHSAWVQFGDNDILETDFTVKVEQTISEQPQLKAPWRGTARITQGNYGSTSHYDHGTWDNTYALDVALVVGSDVLAPNAGIAKYVDTNPSGSGGKELAIEHTGQTGKKFVTVYLHLSDILVEEGDFIKQGQIVAKSGDTGDVTGPHLHFHMWSGVGSYDSHTIPIERLILKQVGVDSNFREYDARKGELDDDQIAGKYFNSNNGLVERIYGIPVDFRFTNNIWKGDDLPRVRYLKFY